MVVIHVSMDDPLIGIPHRGPFPSPRHMRYLIKLDMPTTETVRGPPDYPLFFLTDTVREALSLPLKNGEKLQPWVPGQSYHSLRSFGDPTTVGAFIGSGSGNASRHPTKSSIA